MATFTPIATLQSQANFIRDNVTTGAILKGLLRTDNWATVQTKIVAQDNYSNTDVTITTVTNDVSVAIAGRTDIDPSDSALATEDLSFALLDSTNQRVLVVLDANNRVIPNDSGDRVSWNQNTYFIRDSTSV